MKKYLRMKNLALLLCAAAALLAIAAIPTFAADEKPKPKTLFTNVHIFDGVNEKRIENANVLVQGNPLVDLSAVTDQDNLKIIIKDGKIYKNALQ